MKNMKNMKKNILLGVGIGMVYAVSGYATISYKNLDFDGTLQLDERVFLRKGKRKDLHSGAYIKKLDFGLGVKLNENLSFTGGLGFKAKDSKVKVNDAYLTYTGYKGLGDNFSISFGKVNPSFCLESTGSSKWTPFLERSMATTAFGPDAGLGVSINKWKYHDYTINVTVDQERPDEQVKDASDKELKRSDRLQFNLRATKAKWFGDYKFLQLGFSGHVQDHHGAGLEFATSPEAQARHGTDMLLNTTVDSIRIKARNHYVLGLELMGQNGPWSVRSEGFLAKVKRDKTQSTMSPKFKSYYATVSYVLTGEAREFKDAQAILGRVNPVSDNGAWEVSGRYSFLDLTNKDIRGGSDRSVGMAFTWYANYNISVTGEYMKHYAKKQKTLEKLHFDSIGARLQLVF